MAVAENFGAKIVTMTNLNIDAGALYLLAGPSVPPASYLCARARRRRPIRNSNVDFRR
jgi:hypothetical protein